MSSARDRLRPKTKQHPPPAPIPPSPQPQWLRIAALALAAICLLGFFSTEIKDTDFWWHLKTGQYVVERHSLPVPDPFAYTTALNPPAYPGEDQVRHFNLTHEWLSQVLMYAAYLIGGFPLIVLVRALLLTGVCAISGLLAARLSGNLYAGLAASFATAALAIEFAADRPSLLTFLFVAIFVALLEFGGRLIWILPALALLWANCHGGFFMGWIVLLAYCAETFLPGSRATLSEKRRLWMITAGSIAISGLNPNGFGVLATLFKYRSSELTANLVEWHAPYLWGPPYAFDILLYASVAVLILSWRKVRPAHWLLFIAFAGASLLAFRNVLLIGFLAPVLIVAYFPYRFRMPRTLAWVVPAALLAVLVTGFVRGSVFQLHAATWSTPASAADYLLKNYTDGHLFNTYEQGGYLIWRLGPQQKVFIDGRAISESANRDYREIIYNFGSPPEQVSGKRAELLNRYGIQTVAMNAFEYVSGVIYPLAIALSNPNSTEWQLVYDDAQELIFRHNPPTGTPVFPDKAVRVLNHLDTECAAHIEHSPATPMCARELADYWLRMGRQDRGRRMLQLYLAHAPERDPEAEQAMRRIGL